MEETIKDPLNNKSNFTDKLYYKEVAGIMIPCTVLEWAEWFENFDNRKIKRTYLGENYVSTVALGLNTSIYDKPDLYETMVFGGLLNECQLRSTTRSEALVAHCTLTGYLADIRALVAKGARWRRVKKYMQGNTDAPFYCNYYQSEYRATYNK